MLLKYPFIVCQIECQGVLFNKEYYSTAGNTGRGTILEISLCQN